MCQQGRSTCAVSDKGAQIQSITPLQVAELQPRDRLLVVTCAYQLADKTEASDDMEDRFVLAADSLGFHLITALFSQETATS